MDRLIASPVSAGWISLRLDEPGATDYYVRCRDNGRGGIEIVGLLVSTPDGRVTAARLRDVPLARIEASINASDVLLDLAGRAGDASEDPVLRWLDNSPIDYRGELVPTSAEMVEPLRRPDGKDPDAFYSLVAGRYRDLVRTSAKPAVLMAEEADVPVATARRWILEARRRGLLPAGRQGRAQ